MKDKEAIVWRILQHLSSNFVFFFPNKSISFIEDKIWRFYVTSGNLPSCCAILKGGEGGGGQI